MLEQIIQAVVADGGKVNVIDSDITIILPKTITGYKLFRLGLFLESERSESTNLLFPYSMISCLDDNIIIEGQILNCKD